MIIDNIVNKYYNKNWNRKIEGKGTKFLHEYFRGIK